MSKTTATELLENAYGVETPADSVAYYQDFAAVYDDGFVDALGYCYHTELAKLFHASLPNTARAVADIGCGTGIVAQALGLPADQIDGFDISPDMLAKAEAKGLYHRLVEVDLTQPLGPPPRRYGAVVSAGTFTHGHLGPGSLLALLDWAQPGAFFCVGVNAEHYTAHGFEAALTSAQTADRVSNPRNQEIRLYSKPGHPHSEDTALVVMFERS